MKALSLRHPYAELLANGQKTIELRSWNTKHRGKFLIHASKYKPSLSELESFGLKLDELEFGALIGSAELTSVKNYDDLDESEWENDIPLHLAGINYVTSTKGFIIKNAKKFSEPIPYKGQLNFFNVTDTVQTKIDVKSSSSETTVVNIKNSTYDVVIGRPSKWGNPFVIGKDGNRKQVIKKYRQWIQTIRPELMNQLHELKGKTLGCYCKPQDCHGDVLKELVDKLDK